MNTVEYFPFKTPRKHQLEAVQRCLDLLQTYDDVLLSAPTGAGKAGVAVGVAGAFNAANDASTFITSPLVALVDQYAAEAAFKDKLFTITGRSNYPCTDSMVGTCADNICHVLNQRDGNRSRSCEWNTQHVPTALRARILNATLAVLWKNAETFADPPRGLLIVDEAHLLPDAASLHLGFRIPSEYGPFPADDAAAHAAWLSKVSTEALEKATLLKQRITSCTERQAVAMAKEMREADSLAIAADQASQRLAVMAWRKESSYIGGQQREWMAYEPVQVGASVHRLVRMLAKKRLYMSATPPLPSEIGLSPDTPVVEVPSTFPAAQRPIVVDSVGRMGYKDREKNAGKVARRIVDISRTGMTLCHASSYYMARLIATHLDQLGAKYVLQDRQNREASLSEWRAGKSGNVFLSVNMRDGIDLPDDACRNVVFINLPFPPRDDPVMKKRLEVEGEDFYLAITARAVVQGCGRSVRHDKDWAISWILDGNYAMLQSKAGAALPAWFREAVVWKTAKLKEA